jgi:hypothetical protein
LEMVDLYDEVGIGGVLLPVIKSRLSWTLLTFWLVLCRLYELWVVQLVLGDSGAVGAAS